MFKTISKNRVLRSVFSTVIGVAFSTSVFAAYPDKPIKMLIGYAPGSSTDIVGRMIANDLSMVLKQPIVVENRGGAAGSLAADAVAKSAPDGYTILFAQNGLAINVAANPKLPFNGQKDLVPVVGVAATPHILIVNNNSPAKTVAVIPESPRHQAHQHSVQRHWSSVNRPVGRASRPPLRPNYTNYPLHQGWPRKNLWDNHSQTFTSHSELTNSERAGPQRL